MDLLKGGLVVHPPLLDMNNYGYWKACMHAFIKSMDKLAWKAVLTGWTPTKKDESRNEVPKRNLTGLLMKTSSRQITRRLLTSFSMV